MGGGGRRESGIQVCCGRGDDDVGGGGLGVGGLGEGGVGGAVTEV